jgi:hypothetical protein
MTDDLLPNMDFDLGNPPSLVRRDRRTGERKEPAKELSRRVNQRAI